jgi:hypothetical protein
VTTDMTEMEQRVLAELEECWDQNVFTMLNTIIQPAGDAQEVAAFQQSLVGLVERDYIVMGLEAFHPREIEKFDKMASQELLASLGDWFKFDAADPHWTLAKGDIKKERIPIILSTASGRQKADEILRERGYQWWRHKK